MRSKFYPAIVCIAIVVAVFAAGVPRAAADEPEASVADLRAAASVADLRIGSLSQFMTGEQGSFRWNDRAARGASADRLHRALGKQLVGASNELYRQMTAGRTLAEVDLRGWPLVDALFTDPVIKASLKDQSREEAMGAMAVNPCGDFGYPVPNYRPARFLVSSTTSQADAEALLRGMGYHRTAGYACGAIYQCAADWTQSRGYNGPYGSCGKPAFRNHGIREVNHNVTAQYGEPNPEVLGYIWPHGGWGPYVKWWHDNF